MSEDSDITFGEVLAILQDDSPMLPVAAIYGLSALHSEHATQLAAVWPNLSSSRRQEILTRLNETGERHFELDFSAVAQLALDDPDETIRWLAIAGLWELQTPTLLRRLIAMLENDPSPTVREKAASALGPYILMAELGKMTHELVAPAKQLLLQIVTESQEQPGIRRNALESLAYSSHDELHELIEDAYYHDDPHMQKSAIFAMGRSCDNRWSSYILDELENASEERRFEAARAAGELQLSEALPALLEMLDDDDIEIRAIIIWALGEIGGPEARQALSHAATLHQNENLQENIADALAMAALSEGTLGLVELSDDNNKPGVIL